MFPDPLKTELMTVRVASGMETEAEAWLQMLRDRHAECVATLDRERMRYETIFKVWREGRLFLTWFSVQGDKGASVHTSEHPVDVAHMDYWKRCIDKDWPPEFHAHAVSFAPPEVSSAVLAPQ